MGDDPMLERAEVFHDALEVELADFTARFPWLDATWLASFQADITAADAFPTDDSVVLDIKVLTGDVGAAMQQGYAGLLTLGAYAKLAYPTDLARQKVFGNQNWTAARNSTLKLQEALELAHSKAEMAEYKTALLNKGYTQAEIDMLLTLSDELKLKNRLQEAAKMGRHVTKHDRIALHNVVWQRMQTINTCAEVVRVSDKERKAQYQLYPSEGAPDVTTVIVITKDQSDNFISDMTVTLTNTTLVPQTTDTAGRVVFANASIPETVDVRLQHPMGGPWDVPNQPIIPGEENELTFIIGPSGPIL